MTVRKHTDLQIIYRKSHKSSSKRAQGQELKRPKDRARNSAHFSGRTRRRKIVYGKE